MIKFKWTVMHSVTLLEVDDYYIGCFYRGNVLEQPSPRQWLRMLLGEQLTGTRCSAFLDFNDMIDALRKSVSEASWDNFNDRVRTDVAISALLSEYGVDENMRCWYKDTLRVGDVFNLK
jgi:hypothetical protein